MPPRKISSERTASAGWNSEPSRPPANWETLDSDDTESHAETRRRLFPHLDENDRSYFATLHSDLICRFDKDGVLGGKYGNWTREGPEVVIALIRNARQQSATHYGETIVPGWNVPFRVFFLWDETGQSQYAFVNIEKIILDYERRKLSADSPWEIPFYRYKANLREVHPGVRLPGFSTNNLGLRGPEVAIPKQQGVFRILCIGGSTTLEGEEDATYPKLLEKSLQEEFPGRPIEVLNCGVPGMTTSRQLLKLPEYVQMQPDLLVIYEGVNDIWHDLPVVWESRKSRLGRILDSSFLIRSQMNQLLFPSKDDIAHDLDALIITNLRAMCRAARTSGIRTVICGIAYPHMGGLSRQERAYLDYTARTAQTSRCFSAQVYCDTAAQLCAMLKDLCVTDKMLYVPVDEEIGDGLSCFEDICHMNPQAIARKAQVISDYLKDYIAPAMTMKRGE